MPIFGKSASGKKSGTTSGIKSATGVNEGDYLVYRGGLSICREKVKKTMFKTSNEHIIDIYLSHSPNPDRRTVTLGNNPEVWRKITEEVFFEGLHKMWEIHKYNSFIEANPALVNTDGHQWLISKKEEEAKEEAVKKAKVVKKATEDALKNAAGAATQASDAKATRLAELAAEQGRLAAEQDRLAAADAEAAKVEQERLAAEQDRLAAEKVRLAAEKTAAETTAAEKTAAEELAKKAAAEKVRLAAADAEAAEQDRLAAEEAEEADEAKAGARRAELAKIVAVAQKAARRDPSDPLALAVDGMSDGDYNTVYNYNGSIDGWSIFISDTGKYIYRMVENGAWEMRDTPEPDPNIQSAASIQSVGTDIPMGTNTWNSSDPSGKVKVTVTRLNNKSDIDAVVMWQNKSADYLGKGRSFVGKLQDEKQYKFEMSPISTGGGEIRIDDAVIEMKQGSTQEEINITRYSHKNNKPEKHTLYSNDYNNYMVLMKIAMKSGAMVFQDRHSLNTHTVQRRLDFWRNGYYN